MILVERPSSVQAVVEFSATYPKREFMTDEPISDGSGTAEHPWQLKTPPLTSDYTLHRDLRDGAEVLVCTVGKSVLLYDARGIDDLHSMLTERGGWVELGSADERKPAKEGTVEAWGRSPSNPIGGWYGLKKGMRGRFGMYIPHARPHPQGTPGPRLLRSGEKGRLVVSGRGDSLGS